MLLHNTEATLLITLEDDIKEVLKISTFLDLTFDYPIVTVETTESPRKHRYQTVLEQQLYNPALSGKMDPESHFGCCSSI